MGGRLGLLPLPQGEGWGEGLRSIECSTGMMVDILDRHDSRQFWLFGRFGRFAEPLTRRSEPGEPAEAIDKADVEITEPHDMVAGFEFRDADQLAHQRLTDKDMLTLPPDLARAAHPAHLVIGIIPGLLDAIRHRPRRSRVKFRRRPLAQRFMWALLVVVSAEAVEADLLFGSARRHRARRLCL